MNLTIVRTISYGTQRISFTVIYSDRKTLEIAVHPNQSVIVKAPRDASLEIVDQKVKTRAHWILKQQHYFSQFYPRTPSRQYIGGETHLYLGKQYRLKIQADSQLSVKLKGQFLTITTTEPNNPDMTRKLLEKWYLERAKFKFEERLDSCFTTFKSLNYHRPTLQIRNLSKRWGSLTKKGTIILNRDLIRASSRYIDYVITHELCHLKYPNHSANFYRFLSSIMPDWEIRKSKLEQMLV